MSRVCATLCVLVLCCGGDVLYTAAPEKSPVEMCIDRVAARYKTGKNGADTKLEQQFQADIIRCQAPSISKGAAVCVGAVNVDYTRLAAQLAAGTLSPSKYLQLVRDRRRKAERCSGDQRWNAAYLAGDRDNDLVPDTYDRCAATPSLMATDDAGCPVPDPSPEQGPSPQDVSGFFKLSTVLPNPKCSDAPRPTVPAVVKFSIVGNPVIQPKFHIELWDIANQPAGCPIVYEVRVEEIVPLVLPDPLHEYHSPRRVTLRFRPQDAVNGSIVNEPLVFETYGGNPLVFWAFGPAYRVLAINGNGSVSPWSRKYTQPR
jgi:hypothetical protein